MKKKLDLRSGSQFHSHFVWFFNVPVQIPTQDHPVYVYSEKPPNLVAFYDAHWDTEYLFSSRSPRGKLNRNIQF